MPLTVCYERVLCCFKVYLTSPSVLLCRYKFIYSLVGVFQEEFRDFRDIKITHGSFPCNRNHCLIPSQRCNGDVVDMHYLTRPGHA